MRFTRRFLRRRGLRSGDNRRSPVLNGLILSKGCQSRLDQGLRCSLALSWGRSWLPPCLSASQGFVVLLVIHIIILEVFVPVLDEQVINGFLPSFSVQRQYEPYQQQLAAHSLLIRAAKISSSDAPFHNVFRLPIISGSISSTELTGLSTSSKLGGETN